MNKFTKDDVCNLNTSLPMPTNPKSIVLIGAGGIVSDYPNGNFNLTNGRILASTPQIKKELQDELSKVMPLERHSYGEPEIIDN